MGSTLKNTGLISLGAIAGLAVSMQFSALAQRPVEPAMPLEELRQLSDVYSIIKSDYVEAVDDKKLLTEAVNGMVASLDPHSAYLDKKAFRELREGTEGKFVGLGIEIAQSEEGYIRIVAPIEDSPAWRAGIKAGDLITGIDTFSVQGLGLEEAVKKMRGEPHTTVKLIVTRRDEPRPLSFTVTREEIVQKSVKGKIVEPGYAWLRISQFQEPTVDDMASKIVALYKQDPNIKGLVLDLRNDPGGLLQGAIAVAAAFLPKDAEIVSTNGQLPDSHVRYFGRPEFYALRGEGDALSKLPAALKTVPLVVLVNTGSASASEIVAGALQDYKRGIIIGSQTFGKGSVQTIRPLSNETAVKLTTARYYTPNGRSIQARGIVPELLVDETAEGDGLNALRLREADLVKHLINDRDKEIAKSAKAGESGKGGKAGKADQIDKTDNASDARDDHDEVEDELRMAAVERKQRKPLEYGSATDFQLMQALNHLKGLPVQLSKTATGSTVAQHAAKPAKAPAH